MLNVDSTIHVLGGATNPLPRGRELHPQVKFFFSLHRTIRDHSMFTPNIGFNFLKRAVRRAFSKGGGKDVFCSFYAEEPKDTAGIVPSPIIDQLSSFMLRSCPALSLMFNIGITSRRFTDVIGNQCLRPFRCSTALLMP